MIELLTSTTPNGYKVSIMLEELAVAYKVKHIKLAKKEQKEPWFLKINPNGRIPAIIDHENNDFAVFESGAILLYLAEKHGNKFLGEGNKRSEVIQWLMFQMGGVGPMQGQANVFYRYAEEKIPFAIERYQKETLRLYGVLEKQLQDKEYIVDEVSIADFATFPWVAGYEWSGVSLEGLPNIKRWLSTMNKRSGVQRGLQVPARIDIQQKTEEITKAGKEIIK